jgi:hypothetical protein
MIKLDSFTEFEDGNFTLLDLSNRSLEKTAMYSEIEEFLKTLKPVPNRSYLHINMLGSSEIYGATRNGDFFSTETLIKYHKSFQTTPAKFFRSHRNKKDSPSFGVCIFSTFNPVMKRIELIVEADEETSMELDALMSKGIYPKTSMACRLPFDRCSICGNKARTRQEYCKHLMFEMNKVYPDGRKVVAINEDNITWFDCSMVVRPADPTSSVLTKVAEETPVMSAAERAEIEGFTEKKATIKKWADLIKEISGEGEVLQNATSILKGTADLPLSLIEILRNYDLNQSLAALATLGISPSINFLAELIAKIHLGDGYEGIGELVEEYVKHVPEEAKAPAIHIESPTDSISPNLLSAIAPYMPGSSLLSSAIEKRASGVGYADNGPHIEPTYEEELAAATLLQPQTKNFEVSYGKLLIGLGASALLAKYFISSEIEKRLRDDRNTHIPQNYVKIGLMKRADYMVASSLSKSALATYSPQEQQKAQGDEGIHGLGLARRLLRSTKTKIGGKLSSMLKLVGLGQKAKEVITNQGIVQNENT